MSNTYLVTGGAGFIGSHIVDGILAEGHAVRVLDDFSTGRHANLAGVEKRVEILDGSILDSKVLAEAMRGVHYVLHQAALPSVSRSFENPHRSLEVNALGTLRVLMAAHEAGVRRVVLASSSSVYGGNRKLPKREDQTPLPLSPYASSKLAAEQYAHVYDHVHGLETIALRYFNVFGPRQDPGSAYAAVIPRFMSALRDGKAPQIYGDGKQSRDFTYVANVVHANLAACKAPKAACGRVYNVATGTRENLLDLLKTLGKLRGTRTKPEFCKPRPGDVRHSLADVSAARDALGYSVQVPFEEGLARTGKAFDAAEASVCGL